jgi:hypothetical protein
MSDSRGRYVVGKISTRATTSVQTSLRSEVRARRYDLSKSRESRTGTLGWFRDSNLGVPGICAIWMWVRRSVAEYTIWGMVVASPESGRAESCGPKCPWLVPTPKGVPESELTTWVVCFDADSCLIY